MHGALVVLALARFTFIGKLDKKTFVDIALDDRDPKHVIGVSLRPEHEIKSVIPRARGLRLLTGTRTGTRYTLQEFDAPGHPTATIRARLTQKFYLDGTWNKQKLSSWGHKKWESALSSPLPALEQLHADLRGGRWDAATFDARMACALESRECVWIDALPMLAAGKEPPRASYEPWRSLVLERAGKHDEAVADARDLCTRFAGVACFFLIDLVPGRETLHETCVHQTIACDRYWGDDGIALIDAARRGQADVVDGLLARKVDPNAGGEGTVLTPLLAAVWGGSLPIAKRLVEHGADPNRHGDQLSPLYAAAWGKHEELALYLLAHGAKVDNGSHEAVLWYAAYNDLSRLVHAILALGVDPDDGTVPAGSALTAATDSRDAGMVAELLAHGADPEFQTNHSDGSPIDHARRLHATKILRMLLAAPKKPE